MKTEMGFMLGVVCLCAACLGFASPLSAQEPKRIKTLTGQKGPINGVAYSPDGKTLASGSGDNSIKLWDVNTGKERLTIKGHSAGVLGIAYSPDGKTVASSSRDKTIKLWDVTTGKERATLTGHTDAVYAVACSPDGKLPLMTLRFSGFSYALLMRAPAPSTASANHLDETADFVLSTCRLGLPNEWEWCQGHGCVQENSVIMPNYLHIICGWHGLWKWHTCPEILSD